MSGENISTNMSLPIPGVSVTSGPQWASDLNACFSIIDSHNHAAGSGVQITPSGININADLTFASNSATSLLKAAFTSQSVALAGTNFLSFIAGNLYVNDGSGNQIPITSGGGVAGSPGSIGSLSAPAAATYSAGSKLFTWTADSAKAAAMDNGAVTIRETNVASAKGITIASPTSLAADYSLTLFPSLPGSTSYVSCDSSGNLANVSADTIGAAMTSTGSNAISAVRTRSTGISVGAGGVAISSTCGSFSGNSSSVTNITNLSVTLTTSGRPVFIGCIAGSSLAAYFSADATAGGATGAGIYLFIYRDGSQVSKYLLNVTVSPAPATYLSSTVPPGCLSMIDPVAAGTYNYVVRYQQQLTGSTLFAQEVKLVAYEL